MSKRVKWIFITFILIGVIVAIFGIASRNSDTVSYTEYSDKAGIYIDSNNEIQDITVTYEEDMILIENMIKECLAVYHTYSQLDNTYMCKMQREYMTPQCLYFYLMARMDGKAPWKNDEELMEFLDSYEPNRTNNQYITNPDMECHISDISTVFEPLNDTDGILWCYYEVCHDYKTIAEDEYYDQMARLSVTKTDGKWKVYYIDFISLGGIKGYYEAR